MVKRKLLTAIFVVAFAFLNISSFVYSEETYPQRIISLGPATTEELYILGVESRLVGCTVYCRRPPEARAKEKVGTALETNIEKIVTLQPDLVVATSLTNPDAKEKLESLGIKVITFPEPASFGEVCEYFLELGRMVGKESEAEEIVGIVKDRVDSVRDKVKGLARPRVFVQVGAKPLVAITEGSFVNDFIELAGGTNVVQGSRNARYSREKVLEDNPDIIIIVTMGINGEEERKLWQRFETLRAVKDDRIYIIDPHRVTSPTPLTFVETLEEVVEILHPQLKDVAR